MALFNGVDKALLQRTARELEAQATKLEKAVAGVWAGQRKAKQTFDALHRDARDLRALVKRMLGLAKPPVVFNELRAAIAKMSSNTTEQFSAAHIEDLNNLRSLVDRLQLESEGALP